MRKPIVYTPEFDYSINEELPKIILDAFSKTGWNALGVYEMVNRVKREFKRKNIPVTAKEKAKKDAILKAQQELKERMEKLKQLPSPTLEEVERQFRACEEHSMDYITKPIKEASYIR